MPTCLIVFPALDMRVPASRRPVDRLAGASCATLAALCCLVAAPRARAAADDINAEPVMSGGFDAMVARSRRLVDSVVETEQAVVHALKENATSSWVAPSWSLSADAPIVHGRAVDYMMRANASAAAATAANSAETAPRTTGADLSFGARLRVLRGDADLHIPVVSWMADVQPASSAALSSSTALRPSTHLSAEWSLPGDFSLGVMPGMAVDLDAYGRRTANGTLAVTVGKAWSPQWRTFVDMARDRLAAVQLAGVSTTLDAGVSFAATPATQLDFAVTHGLSPAAPPFQAGVGVSSSF
jgi:hypothetical protein